MKKIIEPVVNSEEAGKRIRKLREKKFVYNQKGKAHRMTQYELADGVEGKPGIPFSRSTIQRHENGEKLDRSTLEVYAKYFKVPVEYLLGETDIENIAEYEAFQENCALEGYEEILKAEDVRIQHEQYFFDRCGYQYEYIGRKAEYDFDELDGSEKHFSGPHKLTDKHGETVYLTDDEFEDLKTKLQKMISAALFLMEQERKYGNS